MEEITENPWRICSSNNYLKIIKPGEGPGEKLEVL
jgi:hypothetical protein